MERRVYTPYAKYGIVLMLIFDLICFGVVPGFLIWVVQIIWIPVFAAGVINGIGHYWGYRNFESRHRRTGIVDSSTNIFPWGILIGGEELHNNHHAHELSPKLSVKWFEFDIGWMYICIFDKLGLVESMRKERIYSEGNTA
jgi:stearoyl-CoA desaturase (delta-9 desaturase)